MNAKLLNMTAVFSEIARAEENQEEISEDLISLESVPRNNQPVEDFRSLVSNLQTIEESMTAKAKTLSQKRHLLHTWEKLKTLLTLMTERLEKDIQHADYIERQQQEAKEKVRMLQMTSGITSRFN